MSQIVKYVCEELDNVEMSCIVVNDEPWFKGIEVAALLGYKCPKKALFDHAPLKFKNKLTYLVSQSKVTKTVTLGANELNAPWICEAGLYKLILKSKAINAEVWVCEEVLPSIRKTGSYAPALLGQQVKLLSETDLHYNVMDCIRNEFPELHVVPGLGEMQTATQQRSGGWNE